MTTSYLPISFSKTFYDFFKNIYKCLSILLQNIDKNICNAIKLKENLIGAKKCNNTGHLF